MYGWQAIKTKAYFKAFKNELNNYKLLTGCI